mgnify:CR=1 FL=1
MHGGHGEFLIIELFTTQQLLSIVFSVTIYSIVSSRISQTIKGHPGLNPG